MGQLQLVARGSSPQFARLVGVHDLADELLVGCLLAMIWPTELLVGCLVATIWPTQLLVGCLLGGANLVGCLLGGVFLFFFEGHLLREQIHIPARWRQSDCDM